VNDEFYIGWEEQAPARVGAWVRWTVVALAGVAVLLSLGLSATQRTIGRATYDWTNEQQVTGILRCAPVPLLEVIDESGRSHSQLLVAPWKYGFDVKLAETYDGRRVQLTGKRIQRGEQIMIETALDSVTLLVVDEKAPPPAPAPVSMGMQSLSGEIVDSKCWLGVMNPGRLTPHRACAVRCLSGGIPPILLVQYDDGRKEHYLLVGRDGRALNREILDFVAEPVSIAGDVLRHGDLLVLRAEPEDIRRIGSEKR
jgi:hypothetical protein